MTLLMGGRPWINENGFFYGPCGVKAYESFYFMIGGDYFEVTPEHFVRSSRSIEDPDYCLLSLGVNDSEYWLLGLPFLRGYYTIWDEERGMVGFAPHKYSTNSIVPKAPLPT